MVYEYKKLKERSSRSINSDLLIVTKYQQTWRVSSDVLVSFQAVRDALDADLGIYPGAQYPDDDWATCGMIDVDRLFHGEGVYTWDCEIEYSTDTPPGVYDPVLAPVKRKVFTNETSRSIFRDKNGDLITDAAGMPFDGGIPVQHHMPTITWQRNELGATFNTANFLALSGTVNSGSFAGCDPGTLLLVATAEEVFAGKFHYWNCQYTITWNDQGWKPQVVNAGLWELDTTGGSPKLKRIIINGEPAQDPQPLTTGGVMVPFADRPADCNWITVEYRGEMDFEDLNLPL